MARFILIKSPGSAPRRPEKARASRRTPFVFLPMEEMTICRCLSAYQEFFRRRRTSVTPVSQVGARSEIGNFLFPKDSNSVGRFLWVGASTDSAAFRQFQLLRNITVSAFRLRRTWR